jgi:putative SOS response-associated peptidase YedK
MCGALAFTKTDSWNTRFFTSNYFGLPPCYNIRPLMKTLIITRNSPNKGELKQFGIHAPWDPKLLLINAMSETISTKKTFRDMFLSHRCLVPANVFYEWKRITPKDKIPYAITIKNNNGFAFAGIYNDEGFLIITTQPNSLMEPIHRRMPVILNQDDEDSWLNPDTPVEQLMAMLTPYSSEQMERWPISSLVNSVKNQSRDILRPAPSMDTLFED